MLYYVKQLAQRSDLEIFESFSTVQSIWNQLKLVAERIEAARLRVLVTQVRPSRLREVELMIELDRGPEKSG